MFTQTFVEITLDKPRKMRLTLSDMARYHELTGLNLLGGFQPQEMTPDKFTKLIWVCLTHEDKDLTAEQVSLMIDASNQSYVLGKFIELYKASAPVKDPAEDSSPNS